MTKIRFTRNLTLAALAAALFIAPAANACQLVCVKTTALYDGNLGGLAGADAKCQTEFPGFRFPRAASLVESFALGSSTSTDKWGYHYNNNNYYKAFYDVDLDGYYEYSSAWDGKVTLGEHNGFGAPVVNYYDCNGWTSSDASNKGGTMGGLSSSPSTTFNYYQPNYCQLKMPLVCCNMGG